MQRSSEPDKLDPFVSERCLVLQEAQPSTSTKPVTDADDGLQSLAQNLKKQSSAGQTLSG